MSLMDDIKGVEQAITKAQQRYASPDYARQQNEALQQSMYNDMVAEQLRQQQEQQRQAEALQLQTMQFAPTQDIPSINTNEQEDTSAWQYAVDTAKAFANLPLTAVKLAPAVAEGAKNFDEGTEVATAAGGEWLADLSNDDVRGTANSLYRGYLEQGGEAIVGVPHSTNFLGSASIDKTAFADLYNKTIDALRKGEISFRSNEDTVVKGRFLSAKSAQMLDAMMRYAKGERNKVLNPETIESREFHDNMQGWRHDAQSRMAANPYERGTAEYYAFGFGDSGARMLPALAAGYATRNPTLTAGILATPIATTAYGEAVDKGLDTGTASTYALLTGASEFIPGKIVIGSILNQTGRGIAKNALKGLVKEGTEEMITEALQMGLDYGFLDKSVTVKEGLLNMRDAFILGGAMGTTMGGVQGGINNLTVPKENADGETGLQQRLSLLRRIGNLRRQQDAQNAETLAEMPNVGEQQPTQQTPQTPAPQDSAFTDLIDDAAQYQTTAELLNNQTGQTTEPTTETAQPQPPTPRSQQRSITAKNGVINVNNQDYQVKYRVVEADDLSATTHKASNQFRDRDGRIASQQQIQSIATNPDYKRLTESPVMDIGAPTLANDGATVIAGNGRLAGLASAYNSGTADGYKQSLIADAPNLGLDANAVAAMQKPVLVREFAQPVNVEEMAIASNEGQTLAMSSLENARADAQRLPPLSTLSAGSNGELNTASNGDFIRGFVANLPQSQQNALMDKGGVLSQEGETRLTNAVLYQAYGDSTALNRLVESTDAGRKNILNALTKIAPKVAQAKGRMADGTLPQADISDDIVAVIEKIAQLSANETKVSDYLAQQGLFGADLSPTGQRLLAYLEANKNSGKAIFELFDRYYDKVLSQQNPQNGNLFGGAPVSSEQLFTESLNEQQQDGRPLGQTVSDSGSGQQQTRPVSGSAGRTGSGTANTTATTTEPTAETQQVNQQSTQAPDSGAFSFDDTPIIDGEALKVTQEEIAKSNTRIKALRTKAKKLAMAFVGMRKNIASGFNIKIGANGIKHTITGAQDDLLSTLPYLDKIIEQSAYMHSAPDAKNNKAVKQHHYFGIRYRINGETKNIVVDVREMSDGKYYYDHAFTKETANDDTHTGGDLLPLEPIAQSEVALADTNNIPQNPTKSKETGYQLPDDVGNDWSYMKDGKQIAAEDLTPRQQLVVDAVAKARQAGKQYSAEVVDFVTKELNISDDVQNVKWRAKDPFSGSAVEQDIYMAGLRLDRINSLAESKRQDKRLKTLHKGDKTGTLYVYQNGKGKLFRGTEVVNVGDGQITVRGALGGKKVAYTTDYSTFVRSLEEAIKRGKRAKKDPDLTHLLDAESDAVAFAKATDSGAFSLPENNTEISEVGKEIKSLFHQAVSGELSGKPVAVGRLTQQGKVFLEELSGLSFKTDIDFVLNPSDLNHIYRDHYGKNEKDKGNNIPLNDGDIEMMASVIYQPDAVVFIGYDKKTQSNKFQFLKEADKGAYNLVEVYGNKRGNLTAKTYYHTKRGVAQRVMDANKSLLPTSETYFGTYPNTNVPVLFEKINENPTKSKEDTQIRADLEKQLGKKAADKVVIDREGKSAGKHSEDAKGAEGWYANGDKVYINPDNIHPLYDSKGNQILSKSERIAFVAWHELGHRGIEVNRLWAKFENNLKKASNNPFVSQLAQAFQADRSAKGAPLTDLQATEEALVEINAAMVTGKMDALTAKWGLKAPFDKNGVAPFYRRLVELLRRVVGYITGKPSPTLRERLDKPSPTLRERLDKPSTTTGEVLGKPKTQDSNQLNNTQLFELLQTITDGANVPINSQAQGADTKFSLNENSTQINERFNQELQRFVAGKLANNHIFTLGKPGTILRSTGFPDLPIELKAGKLTENANAFWHQFTPNVLIDLPNALNNPLAVFAYGDKTKSQNVIVEIESDGKKFLIGVHFDYDKQGTSINDIRGVFPKDNAEWLNWITQKDKHGDSKLLYMEKEKVQALINQQRTNLAEVAYLDLNTVESIIEKHENVNSDAQFSLPVQDLDNNLVAMHNLSADNLINVDKVGGLPVPSIAIGRADIGFDSFGDITLIADKSMIDPAISGNKTYNSDVYSPRYPQITNDISNGEFNRIFDDANALADTYGFTPISAGSLGLENGRVIDLERSEIAKLAYLLEKGNAPKPKYRQSEVPRNLRKFAGQDAQQLARDPQFQQAVKDHHTKQKGAEIAERLFSSDDATFNLSMDMAYRASNYTGEKQADWVANREAVDKKINTKTTQADYRQWVADKWEQIVDKEQIFKGFTSSGNRRYVPHTLDNLVKEIKGNIKGGENFGGAGAVRGSAAKQFKSIEQIQASRDNIVDTETMTAIKDEINDIYYDLKDKLQPYYQYESYVDDGSISGYARTGRLTDFEGVPAQLKQELDDFINKAKNAPTEYFEAKPQRAVMLNEFVGAVVPNGTPQNVIDILQNNGIAVKKYNPNITGDRTKKVELSARQNDVKFSLPPTNAELESQIVETRKRYGGEKAYKKAKANGKTKLNYFQWVQVRMPNFKRWFGDWELAAKGELIDNLSSVAVTGKPLNKEQAKQAYDGLRDGENKTDGRKTRFVRSALGKITRHQGFDTTIIIPQLKEIFDSSVPIYSENEIIKTGHKKHSNFVGYHNYLNKISVDGQEYFVRTTLQEVKAKPETLKRGFVPNELHSTFVSDIEIYNTDPTVHTENGSATDAGISAMDKKLQQFFDDVKRAQENSSKVTDPDTGEPMVVYHGTNADFSVFKAMNWRDDNVYFTDKKELAQAYGNIIYEVYLNIPDLSVYDAKGKGFNAAYDEGLEQVIYDNGVENNGTKIINIFDHPSGKKKGKKGNVYLLREEDANQIKSAVDNNGEFGLDNDDIKFSIGAEDPKTPPPPFEFLPSQKGLFDKTKDWFDSVLPWKSDDAYDVMFDNMGEFERLVKRGKAEGVEVESLMTGVRDGFKTVNAKIQRDLEQEVEPMMRSLLDAAQKLHQGELGKQLAAIDKKYDNGTKGAERFLHHLDYYIRYALHGKERNATIFINSKGKQLDGSGKTNQEIDELIAQYQDVPAMDKAAKQFYKEQIKPILDYRNQRLLDAGLLTKAMINKGYNWEYYIPLYGRPEEIDPVTGKVIDDAFKRGGQFGKGGKLKEGDHKLRGRSGTDSHSLFETIFTAANVAVSRARMAEAKKAVYDAVQNEDAAELLGATMVEHDISQKQVKKLNKDGEVTWQGANLFDYKAKDAEDTLVYQQGDKAYVIKIKNKRAITAMKNLNRHTENRAMLLSQNITRFIASTYTRFNPNFWWLNKFRDSQAQWIYLLADAPIGEQSGTGQLKEAISNRQDGEGLLSAVGRGLSAEVISYGRASKNIGNRLGAAKRAAVLNAKYTVAWKETSFTNQSEANKEYHQWLEKYRDLGGVTTFAQFLSKDQLQQLSDEFAQMNIDLRTANPQDMKQLAKKYTGKWVDLVDMINDHLELTTRVSAFQALVENGVSEQQAAMWVKDVMNFETKGELGKTLGAFFPFVTTTAYDIQRMSKMVWKTKEGKVLFGGMMALSAMIQELFATLGGDDEDGIPLMDKVPLEIAGGYWVLPLDDIGQGIRFPIGFGIGQMANTMVAATRRWAQGQYTWGEWAGNILINAGVRHLTPIRPSDVKGDALGMAVQTITPLYGKPIVQLWRNQSHFGNQIYQPENWRRKGELAHSSAYPWTYDVYKKTAGLMYKWTGVDVPPEGIAHAMNSYLGGFARTIVDSAELLIDWSGSGDPSTNTQWKQAPIIGGFVQTEPRSDSTAYRDIGDKLKTQHKKHEYEKANRGNVQKYKDAEFWYQRQRAYNKRLRYLGKMEKLVRERYKGEEQRQRLIQLGKQKRYLKQAFNAEFKIAN